jgi:hypothetical protein
MAPLTPTDPREIKNYLTSARTDILRWLPDPAWSPAWKSTAAEELANAEKRRDGSPWGEQPIRMSYATAWFFISAAVDCIDAISQCITPDTPAFIPNALTRTALEAGAQASWLLQHDIGPRRRVARRVLIHDASAHRIRDTVDTVNTQRKPDPKWRTAHYPPTIRTVRDEAADLRLRHEDKTQVTCEGKTRKTFACEEETHPNYTKLASDFAAKIRAPDGYPIWSRAAHAAWDAITADWPGDPFTHPRSTDRESIWAAAVNVTACAMEPCRDALTLLGHNARLAEWNRSYIRSGNLIERMDLPTDWTSP